MKEFSQQQFGLSFSEPTDRDAARTKQAALSWRVAILLFLGVVGCFAAFIIIIELLI